MNWDIGREWYTVDTTILVWNSPDHPPEDASFVLVKYLDDEGALICSPAAYERGQYLEVGGSYVFQTSEVLGWSYFPYDERIKEQGV